MLGNCVRLSHDELDSFIAENCTKDVLTLSWSCNFCGVTRKLKSDIARHLESKHVILPELQCLICLKFFKTRDSLRRHELKYHNTVWNTRFFFSKKWLVLILGHKVSLTHDQLDYFIEQNFGKVENRTICNICGQICTSVIDVSRHIEAKHVILPELLCSICQKPSKTRDSLRRHELKYHSWAAKHKILI